MAEWAVTTANASLEFDTVNGTYNSCYKIDSNHFINFWAGSGDDGFVQVFTVNTSTWAVTTAGASLEFDTTTLGQSSCCAIDSSHFISFFSAYNSDTFAQVFTVNTSTWAVTTAGDRLLIMDDTNTWTRIGFSRSCIQIDSNHFVNSWTGLSTDGYVQAFEVNTSTWAVTTAGASLEFDASQARGISCYKIDSNHFINFWAGSGDDGFVQVFTVNTSTWAVTTAGASLEFDTILGSFNSCYQIDGSHFINFWTDNTKGFGQVFTVNTSTWAVTTAGARLEFDTASINGTYNSCYQIDSNHFINFWATTDLDGFVQAFTVDTSTWAVTTANTSLEFDTVYGVFNSCYQIDSNHFINFWAGTDLDGFVQAFTVELPASDEGTNMQINVGDTWKDVTNLQINIGDTWKPVTKVQINVGDTWKSIF